MVRCAGGRIAGFRFLHTLTLLFNFLFLYSCLQWPKNPRKALGILSGGVVLFALLNVYGWYLKNQWPKPDQKARVLIVQPHVENQIQEEKQYQGFILAKIKQKTAEGLKKYPAVDFVLWPEGAGPMLLILKKREQAQISFNNSS